MIEGAADGAGLGVRFLKHLTRTRLLLHIVDVAPFDQSCPIEAARSIVRELERFSPTLHGRERWLVLNKIDLLPEDEREQRCQEIIDGLDWKGPVFSVAAISRLGVEPICGAVMDYVERCNEAEREDESLRDAEIEKQHQMQAESRERIQQLAAERRAARLLAKEAGENDDDDDDYDVEVVYEQ